MVDDVDAVAIRKFLPIGQVPKLFAIGFDPLAVIEARNGIVAPRSY
jgi:hypothetical protein